MISHDHRAIFVHIPKTGGQSIETAFLQSLGLTWETRAPLLLRSNPDRKLGPNRLSHLYADEYLDLGYVDEPTFAAYLKFTVVRDPYDRAVSEFNYRRRTAHETLRDQFTGVTRNEFRDPWRHVCPQSRYVFRPGQDRLLVDQVLRFEALASEWTKLSARLFADPVPLPHRNRPESVKLKASDLSRPDIDYITETYADDFVNFEYETR